jgi:predicted molibdopterin-dependent oxidoreductase YjgC
MRRRTRKIDITIDNKPCAVDEGMTILEAAECSGVYIPKLCAHKDLTPFGGCRMCIVEVEGIRGFPTACTTPVTDGMSIKTETAQLQKERKEILQLILSEHTSSCLICDERDECSESLDTIRKAGVTTGCRYCPNDGDCELQEVVDYLDVRDIEYPVYYRNLPVEKMDPFYDRDYNICILCGRCIRMCQEIRTANTLAFKQRGNKTVIGPAFERNHLDAGCEFCGACVSVCPTGALAEKSRKWDGREDKRTATTCALCGIGCRLDILVKNDRVIGGLPVEDKLVSDMQLCVKGRFCVPELVNDHHRLKRPTVTRFGANVEISWSEATRIAAEALSSCEPERFGMVVSTDCSNEDLYVAQKFTRAVMGSANIDSSARLHYGDAFRPYLGLLASPAGLSDISVAGAVLCIGLDALYGRSVVGVELRKAARNGAKIVTVNREPHSISLVADRWIKPEAGGEASVLSLLERSILGRGRKTGDIADAAAMIAGAESPVILIGPGILGRSDSERMIETIKKIAGSTGASIMPLPSSCNLAGSVLMGAYPEFLPGASPATSNKFRARLKKIWKSPVPSGRTTWNANSLFSGRKRLKVLYVVGNVPARRRPRADFLIFQNIYPPDPSLKADIVLPAAAFTESDGTFISGEGRIQRFRKAVTPPGDARPDWKIIGMIAKKLGAEGFGFKNDGQVRKEIALLVKGFSGGTVGSRGLIPLDIHGSNGSGKSARRTPGDVSRAFPLLLELGTDEHTYRGFPLSYVVDGARILFPSGYIRINPQDAAGIKLTDGDTAVLAGKGFEAERPVRVTRMQQTGTLGLAMDAGDGPVPGLYAVRIRKKDV